MPPVEVGNLSYTIFSTSWGWVGALGSTAGLCCLLLPQPSLEAAQRYFNKWWPEAIPDPYPFNSLSSRVRRYLRGERADFHDKLDLAEATPFQRTVWGIARSILYGETRSYGWVAQQMGKPQAARAVGQALAENPLPLIIPCHRVVCADGEVGGYTEGPEIKRRLLDLEASRASPA